MRKPPKLTEGDHQAGCEYPLNPLQIPSGLATSIARTRCEYPQNSLRWPPDLLWVPFGPLRVLHGQEVVGEAHV